ncbi:MAG: hypothetical protein IKJ88_01130 [Clostridia bacterium]|nr:hypothetical protein [Clostridia bacterium]
MKTKKLLSILLALMMMLSVVPMYASAAEALKATNVTQWPTLSYKNADNVVHFGQTLADALIINDDEIVLDASGSQVAGHFEFMKPELISTPKVGTKANIKFVPDDTTTYSGFNKLFSSLLYDVVATTPVFVDEINDPVVASEVEVGATLATAVLSGGVMTNPYNANEPNILAREWEWVDGTSVVNESGYYEAVFCPTGYEWVYKQVYVKVKSNAASTTITEAPTATLTYDGVTTWADVELTGGKAMSGDTEVAGKFTVDNAGSTVIEAGTYTRNITFTPDDTENYLPSTGTATVTVNPAPIKFVDENGADIVPEITVPYGTTFSSGDDICIALKNYLNIQSGVARNVYVLDDEGNILDNKTVAPVGTKEYKVIARTDNKNYEEAVLTFNLTVEPIVIEITGAGYSSATNELYASLGKTNIPGTFDIFVDDELVGDDLALTYDTVTCPWTPTETGEHTIKVVYSAVNENYVIADYEKAFTAKVQRTLTYDGYIMLSVGFRENATTAVMGDLVTIKPVLEDFAVWVITDANGNEVTLEGVDLTAREITFTMPDHDVKITFKTNAQLEQEEAIANCDHICHSENPLLQMIWKILHFIFRLFNVQQYCDCGITHYDAPLFG